MLYCNSSSWCYSLLKKASTIVFTLINAIVIAAMADRIPKIKTGIYNGCVAFLNASYMLKGAINIKSTVIAKYRTPRYKISLLVLDT